eukprot:TRINITY_DN10140_c0_g1_i2.p3 TRINITY_DN10140_c0_g1~~TRINITY_DN10140_c0_g1_i2.p3  ORF type:complete len:127 (+),score=5.88 TRINITY_DN10140_c0_g1_i2:511-891(+)
MRGQQTIQNVNQRSRHTVLHWQFDSGRAIPCPFGVHVPAKTAATTTGISCSCTLWKRRSSSYRHLAPALQSSWRYNDDNDRAIGSYEFKLHQHIMASCDNAASTMRQPRKPCGRFTPRYKATHQDV